MEFTPITGMQIGRIAFGSDTSVLADDLNVTLVRVTDRHDDTGPAPGDVLIPGPALRLLGGGLVAFSPTHVVADFDTLTPTTGFVRVRALQGVVAPGKGKSIDVWIVEALTSYGPVSAGNIYAVKSESMLWLNGKYAFVPVDPPADFMFPAGVLAEVAP